MKKQDIDNLRVENPISTGDAEHKMAGKAPLISIITITYNAANEILPTLQSLNAQTFRDFEHIVIDGASKDDTLSLISHHTTHSKVLSEPDRGLYDAMNKGLRLAQGRYLLFLNAGDSLHSPDTLQHYADHITAYHQSHRETSHPWPAIIFGDTVIVDADRNILGPRHHSAPQTLTFRSFQKGMLVCHQAFMVRRDLAPEYNLSYRFSADYEWTLRCLLAAREEILSNNNKGINKEEKKSKKKEIIKNKTTEKEGDNNINIAEVVIDYLSDGLTDKNHIASLKERYRIMDEYYGHIRTFLNHLRFLLRKLR